MCRLSSSNFFLHDIVIRGKVIANIAKLFCNVLGLIFSPTRQTLSSWLHNFKAICPNHAENITSISLVGLYLASVFFLVDPNFFLRLAKKHATKNIFSWNVSLRYIVFLPLLAFLRLIQGLFWQFRRVISVGRWPFLRLVIGG